jgi:ABC-type multidrug transport system fused ATPase/permease subunit
MIIFFIKRSWNLLESSEKNKLIILIFFMFVSGVIELFNLGFLIIILNIFLNKNPEQILLPINQYFDTSFLLSYLSTFSKNNLLILLLFFFSIFFFLRLLILIYSTWREADFHSRFKENISNKLYFNFLNRSTTNLFNKHSSEYIRNFTSEIDLVSVFYVSIIGIILEAITVVLLLLFLIFFNPLVSGLATLIFITISIIYYYFIKDFIFKLSNKRLTNQKKKIQFINESFSAIKLIKILSRENYFYKKFMKENVSLSNIAKNIFFINNIPRYLFESLLLISVLILLFVLIHGNYLFNDIFTILSVYIFISFRLMPSANRILSKFQTFRFSTPSFKKIYAELNIPVVNKSKLLINNISFKDCILIKIKNFFYNNNRDFFLENINIKIKKGDAIGIVGPSGSGKTTLLNIICGFAKPSAAEVIVDKNSIFSNLSGWQKIIGYIPQNIIILNDTFRNNILFGHSINNKLNDKFILNILKKVNLFNFYKKLDKGLDEVIKEDGLNISGGEIQRIGIARALINNPEIIILDESTSALDILTESKIIKEINRLNKTTIIVSHRNSTLKYCNSIYFMKKGKIKSNLKV